MGVEAVFNTRAVWTCDAGAGPARVLAYRYPYAPNLGDITAVDWASVEPVDVIAGGSPCQDLSLAGATPRLGMAPGTRSGLWGAMCDAIETIRPRVVVWENVKGALSAQASSVSDVEPGTGVLGGGGQADLFSGRWAVYSETLPASGMTRNGRLLARPMLEHPTTVSVFSSSPSVVVLRTPCAQEAGGGPLSPSHAAREGRTLRLTGQVLDLMHPGLLPA